MNHQKYILFIAILFAMVFSTCKKKETITPIPKPGLARDQAAYQLHYPELKESLSQKGIQIEQVEIFLRAFKLEEKLEIWVKENSRNHLYFSRNMIFV